MANSTPLYLLEQGQLFSQSVLWELQRYYFSVRGADAWREGEVPHYVTSNPTIAQAYAETVFAFYQDRQRLQAIAEPMTICELGAGSGRFAFHFLRHLLVLCSQWGVPVQSFRYVLSDFAQSNLDAWRKHARFQDWFANGLLDIALFDVDHTDQLQLQLSGQTVRCGTLDHPLVVLANYVFDGVPQDLFYFKDRIANDCLVTLSCASNPNTLDPLDLLTQAETHYAFRPCTSARYPEPDLQALLEQYLDLDQAYLLFPMTGLRCLARLQALSRNGMLLLSADKGEHERSKVALPGLPGLVRHGSFSLNVNYHAFTAWCAAQGGLALRPSAPHQSIALIALLLTENPAGHVATSRAYQQHIASFGPDDFHTLSTNFFLRMQDMAIDEILAFMRFNRADAHHLARLMPRLTELLPTLGEGEVGALKHILHLAWNAYFPLGEQRDLAFELGCMFYALNDFPAALHYFEQTQEIYGRHAGTLFNMAACHEQLGQFQLARSLLEKMLQAAPDNPAARALLDNLPAAA